MSAPGPEMSGKARNLWEALEQDLGPNFLGSYPVLSDAFVIFGQANAAYEGGAHEGTSLLCRSAVEAAMYLFVTHRPRRKGGWTIDPPRYLDGNVRRVTFDELERAVAEAGILSERQMKDLRRIKDHGDLIAHVAERHVRVMVDVFPKGPPERMRMWVGPTEAYADLVDTAAILESVAKAIVRESSSRNRSRRPLG